MILRATYVNQARVHQGYHYPRSISTAMKSAGYFERFNKDYAFCINKEIFSLFCLSLLFQNPLEQVTLYRVGDFYLGCIAGYFFMRSDFLKGGKHPSWLWNLLEIAVVLLLLPSQLIHEGSLKFISDDAV